VTDDPRDHENREDRDRERSEEAHWRVAEEGAKEQSDRPKEETEKRPEEMRPADKYARRAPAGCSHAASGRPFVERVGDVARRPLMANS
jgi:hypothetical protein